MVHEYNHVDILTLYDSTCGGFNTPTTTRLCAAVTMVELSGSTYLMQIINLFDLP